MNLFITLIFSKNDPPSGYILEMGAWLQKLVKAHWLMMILWPNGTFNNPGLIFIRKLKFSNEFWKVGKFWAKSPSVLSVIKGFYHT